MLISLMLHHVESDSFSNPLKKIDWLFRKISNKYRTFFPGDVIECCRLNLCIVFDDGYYDFYYYVFLLLKKYNIKAVLSIPTKFILDKTDIDPQKRLALKHNLIMKDDNYIKFAPFCTWQEIKEMLISGLVKVASHSHSHIDICGLSTSPIIDELSISKEIIEKKTGQKCEIFTYPYGKYNMSVQSLVKKFYKYAFGIGNYIHFGWSGYNNGIIYRTYADDLDKNVNIFGLKFYFLAGLRTLKFISRNVIKGGNDA